MAQQAAPRSELLLDTCVVINLYATGRMSDILAQQPDGCLIADLVYAEALYVRRGGAGEDAGEREPVALDSIRTAGLLTVVSATEAEIATFAELVFDLDDGEALTLALALHRRLVCVTDDRKARRLAGERGITLLSTLDLVHAWAIAAAVPDDALRSVLAAMRERAAYVPGRIHPLRPWWEAAVGDPE